jgi:hypothetical protein
MTTHHQRSFSSNITAAPLTFDHYNTSNNTNNTNSLPLLHRYNKTVEHKSLSSPRLRVYKILFLGFFLLLKCRFTLDDEFPQNISYCHSQ